LAAALLFASVTGVADRATAQGTLGYPQQTVPLREPEPKRPTDPDTPSPADRNAAIDACGRETARRMSVPKQDVRIGNVQVQKDARGRSSFSVEWSVPDGQKGRCECAGGTVLSWNASPAGDSSRVMVDESCVRSVARRLGKRPADIDVLDIEGDEHGLATVLWESYQGERGQCRVNRGLVEKVEFD
jgi:hypothetical protein